MWPTTILVSVLFAAGESDPQNPAAIAFVRTLQTPSGGFVTLPVPPGTEPQPSLRTTRTALRCLRLLGGQPADRDAVIRYLNACHDRASGGFSDRPKAKPDAISTSVGLMILGELKLPVDPYVAPGLKFMNDSTEGFEQIRMVVTALEDLRRRVPKADAWLREIEQARNRDGSYGQGPGKARTTALHVVAQLRLGGKPPSADAVLKVLREGQRPDGGFGGDEEGGSDLEACYRVMRCFSRLDAMPSHSEKLREFIARCRNPDGGYGRRPEEQSSLHGTYYATIVRYWLNGGK
jgi:prenyltransferase beta subunit